jgi:hypothetical protein
MHPKTTFVYHTKSEKFLSPNSTLNSYMDAARADFDNYLTQILLILFKSGDIQKVSSKFGLFLMVHKTQFWVH